MTVLPALNQTLKKLPTQADLHILSTVKFEIFWWDFLLFCFLKSVSSLFNIDLFIFSQNSLSTSKLESAVFDYFAEIFPVEFFTYFETIQFKRFHKMEKQSASRELELTHLPKILEKLKKSEVLKAKIGHRKFIRSQIKLARPKITDFEELSFFEVCKETRVFKNCSVIKITKLIAQISGISFENLKNSTGLIKFIDYLCTVFLKLIDKVFCRENQFWTLEPPQSWFWAFNGPKNGWINPKKFNPKNKPIFCQKRCCFLKREKKKIWWINFQMSSKMWLTLYLADTFRFWEVSL